MKKAYNKPLLIVERFALSQTIASGCNDMSRYGDPTLVRKGECGWNLNDAVVIFLEGVVKCEWQIEDGSMDGICYNAPEGGMNVFHS